MNKKDLEQMSEAARILACRCFCDVRIEGQRMAGIPSWYIICVPRTIRKSMLPVLWPDVVKQAEIEQQWPMLMHIRCGDWACTGLNMWFDDWGKGFDNTTTMTIADWWLFHGEEKAFPSRHLAKASALLGFQVKRQ